MGLSFIIVYVHFQHIVWYPNISDRSNLPCFAFLENVAGAYECSFQQPRHNSGPRVPGSNQLSEVENFDYSWVEVHIMTCHAQRNHATFCVLLRSLGTCLGKCFFFEHEGSQPENVVLLSPVNSCYTWAPWSDALEGLFFLMLDTFDELLMYWCILMSFGLHP